MRDALDPIRKQSKEHDRTGDHYGKGVNLVLKLPDDEDKALVTLGLDNVPLIDALRYVCELSGLKRKVEPHAVRIAHLQEPSFQDNVPIFRPLPRRGRKTYGCGVSMLRDRQASTAILVF